ncbi:MAG: GNAT family N-acetyltransferase [Lachnospiraceae bacterium]|nr:GNAT family N-acetyltransferase [Lachnospiraceae bacterium]
MIKISRYDEKYSNKIEKLFNGLWNEINYHGDVIAESICVAEENGEPVGVGFLIATSSYRYADSHRKGYIDMEYAAVEGDETVEIYALLIDTLIDDYRMICRSEKNRRIILRTFCSASSNDYMSFLSTFGFRADNFMYRMRRDLTEVTPVISEGSYSFVITDPSGKEEKIDVEMIKASKDGVVSGLDGYFEANGSAFGVPDSENELKYRMVKQNGIQFLARARGKVVAAVSVWENSKDRVSTENIFCIKKYRRRGITERLLRYVCGYLSAKGYREASLFVYGVNNYAVGLYTKLGYDIFGGMLHMLYEDGYEPELV